MKLSKRRHSRFSDLKRGMFSYRYIKRNLLIVSAIVVSATGIGTVIKYGEALDHTQEYESANNIYEVVEVTTETLTEITTETAYNDNDSDASIAVKDNDVVAWAVETSEFDGRFVTKVSDTLNVRAEASANADIVGKLFDGNVGDILAEEGDWVKISSGDVVGYVNSEYILTGTEAEEYVKDYISDTNTYEYAMTIDAYTAMVEAENSSYEADNVDDTTEVEIATSDDNADIMYIEDTEVQETTTEVATTEESTTEAATTETPTTEETTTEAPTTEAPTTEETTTEATTTEEATTEADTSTDASQYSDSYLLACLVSMEAGSEPYEGQLAVANVVLNRLNSGKWGSTIYSVIYASNQFPSVTGSTMQYYLDNGPLSSAQKAADEALAGNNNIGSYMSFLNVNYVDTDSLSDYTIIGNHCFY